MSRLSKLTVVLPTERRRLVGGKHNENIAKEVEEENTMKMLTLPSAKELEVVKGKHNENTQNDYYQRS